MKVLKTKSMAKGVKGHVHHLKINSLEIIGDL